MKSIQLIQDVLLKLLTPNRIAVNEKQGEISKELLTLSVSTCRPVNSKSVSDRHLQLEIEGVFKYLCEHNLLFFLLMARKFEVLRKLFHEKPELTKTAVLRKKIKKRRKLLQAKRTHFFNYSNGLYFANNQHRDVNFATNKVFYPQEGDVATQKHSAQGANKIFHCLDEQTPKPPSDIQKARILPNNTNHYRFFVVRKFDLEARTSVFEQKLTLKK